MQTLSNIISRRIYSETGWNDYDPVLTKAEKESFLSIFGYHCRQHTKEGLRHFIETLPKINNWSIYERVTFDGTKCKYVAGQDYPAEIARVRNLILKG